MKYPNKKQQKKVLDFLQQLQWMFGLQNYDRIVVFAKEDYKDFACKVNIEEDYQRIKITVYPCFWGNSLKNQREYILHEFCHFLTEPLTLINWNVIANGEIQTKEHHRFAVEKSTSMIANILDKLLTDNVTFGKKAYKSYLKSK